MYLNIKSKLLTYYYNLKRNYNIYIMIEKNNNWEKIDKIENNFIYYKNNKISLNLIKIFVISYQNGELLDYYGEIDFFPEKLHDTNNPGLISDNIINFSDVDFSNNILDIKHIKNTKHPRKDYYSTIIKNNSNKSIKVIKFGGYTKNENKLYLKNVINSLYSNEQFNEWFYVKNNGWIKSEEEVNDPNNYGGNDGYWIYFCENELGHKFIIGK